jgi:tRNA(fMet)-specific endonuclease VapC
MAAPSYILDTNILVHFVRGSKLWAQIRESHQLLLISPTPVISVVSVGEIRSLALQWTWGERKLEQLEYCLNYFQSHTIDNPTLLRAYATIDAYLEKVGQPLGKNDVWIAATAAVTGTRLLTTDRDFDRLHPRFITREWIDPNTDGAP